MTKRHFEVIAYNLEAIRPHEDALASTKHMWAKAVIAVANSSAEFNPKFDRNRFYAACGGIDDYLKGI